ncbi:MAG: signal peptidase I [Chloroflexota bacterium]|nr:signal peptidase I [Chloroflexota bacterium]
MRRLARDIIETLILALVIYLAVRTLILPYEVEGASMGPALRSGERLFVNRGAYSHFNVNDLWNVLPWEGREGERVVYPFDPPQRGDVIVLEPPVLSEKPYIKRIIGLPGEEIAFQDGYVLVDGRRLGEPYINGALTTCRDGQHCALTVPEGAVFVLGDNRAHSADSRTFGPVSLDRVIGKAFFSNWPLETFGPIE